MEPVLAAERMWEKNWGRLQEPSLSWCTHATLLQLCLGDTGGAVEQLHVPWLGAQVGCSLSWKGL